MTQKELIEKMKANCLEKLEEKKQAKKNEKVNAQPKKEEKSTRTMKLFKR